MMVPQPIENERVEVIRPKFRLVPFEDLKPGDQPTYLVKGLIPRVGLTVAWGPPKCGKSFWTFDAAMHVALGWDYRGRRVQQGPVVYAAFEGAEGFKARAEAFRRHRLPEDAEAVPFFLSPTPMDLVADNGALIASIRVQLGDTVPALVVLDTLNRSLKGSESDDKDMSAYIRAADAIRDAFDCAVIVVHHCGIDGTRPRGHTSLAGAVDCQLAVRRDAAENIVVTIERMKDGPEGDTFTSRLELVEVGVDEDGDPITSCIIVEAEPSKAGHKEPRLTASAAIALKALEEAIAEAGQSPPASQHIPTGTKAVSVDLWRRYAYARGISASEQERARQVAFQRACDRLLAGNHVGIWQTFVWRA